MTNIKIGNLIYRIWPSGHKTLGMAIGYRNLNYSVNPNLIFTHWLALETYRLHGGVNAGDGYGLRDKKNPYEYELIPPGSLQECIYLEAYKDIINAFKNTHK